MAEGYCSDYIQKAIGVSEISGVIKQCKHCHRIFPRDEYLGPEL